MKILYGVPGEGMGHATRSKVVIDYLISKGHEIRIVASDRAFKFLDKSFPGCAIEIKGFHFAYKNAEVSKSGTFMLILKSAAKNLAFNKTKKHLLEHNFKPDLVISDFESFSFVYAKLHKLPIISIDNMQVMDRCKLDIKIAKEERTNYLLAKGIVKFKVPRCHHYFITSFFDAKIEKKHTTLVPPIIRKEIQEAKAAMLGLGFSKTLNGPIKLTAEAMANIGKKYGKDIAKIVMEPEADFAGRVPVRPRDGYINAGTKQIDTPLGKHLISGEVAGRKNQKVISGGHNSDNFYDVLNSNGGKVIGTPTQVSKGIFDIKYQLPNGSVETKTVYDPKVYSDKKMAAMANEAASKAIVNYGVNGNKIQHVIVNGITFRVPISSYKGTNYVPSAFPINPTSGGVK